MTEPKRIAVKLTNRAEQLARNGHPWIFSNSIVKESEEPQSGDIAIIYLKKTNKLLAVGLFDCESPIRIKVLEPKGVQVGEQWFGEKIEEASAKRKGLFPEITNAYRLLFGEADYLSGVICDVYDGNAVLKIYSAAWLPWLNQLSSALLEKVKPKSIILRMSRNLADNSSGFSEGELLHGELPSEEILFHENGVKFSANVLKGHKTGFFLDHRQNRIKIGQMSEGKTVLDVFSYAGGFSVHALAGGAKEVTSIDISQPALDLAEKNAALNPHSGEHITLGGDAFQLLHRLKTEGKTYDIVIIDPPSFAKQKSEIEQALYQYSRLANLGTHLVSRGGILLLASCSSRIKQEEFYELTEKVISQSNSSFELINKAGHDIDHPERDGFPEGRYLKSVYYRRNLD